MSYGRDFLVRELVSHFISELEFHPFIAPYLGVKKPIDAYLHQYEILALLSVRRPVRVLVADEIGLGKTITAIAVSKYLEKVGEAKRILVIVPRILLNQWITELDGMGISNVFDIERHSLDMFRRTGFRPGYYIGSIDLLKRNQYIEAISSIDWDLIIVDEAHKLSIKGSKKTIRYNEIGGKLVGSKLGVHTLFLSATPHKGDPEDYISRLKLLDPMLGSPKELDRRDFYRMTHEALVFRRTKEDINNIYEGREVFKPATFYAVALPATDEEREFSERLLEFMRTKLLEFAEKGLLMDTRAIPLLRALLFKRASSSPRAAMLTIARMFTKRSVEAALDEELLDEVEDMFGLGYEDYEYSEQKDPDDVIDDFIGAVSDLLNERDKQEVKVLYRMAEAIINKGDTKVSTLLEFLSDLMKRGTEKIIVFTEYKDTLQYIKAKILEKHPDWKNALYSMTSEETHDTELFKRMKAKFEEDQNARILLATDVASEGLNLQVANILVNYEVPWSIVKLEQRIGRVWRLGQKRDVEIYTFFLGNRSDLDALHLLYQKLLNLRKAEISPRPLMGQEVLVAGAEEFGKIPMAVTEEGKRFRRVTERTLIDAYVRGGGSELNAIVRSILAAKEALQEEIASKSVFYKTERKERIEERLGLLGFRNVQELTYSVLNLLNAASPFYGYKVAEFDKSRLRIHPPTGMPIVISKVSEVIEMLRQEGSFQSPAPVLVSYGPEEKTVLLFSVEVVGRQTHLLLRQPIGVSESGEVFTGRNLVDVISRSLENLIGVSEESGSNELDKTLVAQGPNSAQDSAGRLLNRIEEYLSTLIKLGLRNSREVFILKKELNGNLRTQPIGIMKFVKKPFVALEDIPLGVRLEAEQKAVKAVLEVEKREGRLARVVPQSEQNFKHYDIYSMDPKTKEERLIEVKGHMGPEVYGELTDGEASVARNDKSRYWLYIVYDIGSSFKLLRFQDPFNTMNYRIVEKMTKETRYVLWPKAVQL